MPSPPMPDLDLVWAPWRMALFTPYHGEARPARGDGGALPKGFPKKPRRSSRGTGFTQAPSRGCVLCRAARSRSDRQHYVVARGTSAVVLLNRYPYTSGHVLVAPRRHLGDFQALRPTEWAEIYRLSRRLVARLSRTLHPSGFNIGLNLGEAGGAGIPGHLHLHIVPRWVGDTNYMTTVAHARVLPHSLDHIYGLLRSEP